MKPRNTYAIPAKARKNAGPMVHKGSVRNKRADIEERVSEMEPTMEELQEAIEGYLGWCTECQEFTTGCCEPDARGYECEVCGEKTVYGAEEALMMGEF